MSSFKYHKLADLTVRIKVGFVGLVNEFYCEPENGIPIIRTTDIDSIDFDKLKYVTNEFHVKNKKSQLKKGDLIIARHGENGNAIIYEHERCAQVLNAVIIEPDPKKISSELLKIFFDSPFVKKQISGSVKGSVQGVINTKHISDLLLNIGNHINYEFITKTITNFSRKIALNNKINTELEAMAKLIYDYWFVQFDFPDANGKPYKSSGGKMVYNEELKREIPAGWKLEAVGEHLNIYDSNRIPMSRKERDAKQGPYPYFGATGVMDHVNDYIFDDDYILVAEDGSIMDESGMPIVQFIWGKTWVNNHAHVMQAKKKSQNEFYFQSLKRIPVVLIKTGSIQLKINQANLMAYKLLVPNDELVNKYSFLSGSVREKLKSNSEETKKLIELRDWLLPMLMNGQVTVKGTHHCTKGKLKRGSTIL